MEIIELPQDAEKRNKKSAALTRNRKALGGFVIVFAVFAVLSLLGALVSLVLTEAGERSASEETLLFILTGAFVGGAVLFALLAFLLSKASQSAYLTELDYRERCDGENSFFVGEGTLATFEKTGVRLHAEKGGREEIRVPYSEMRFFSVCTRKKPQDKGEWSVVMEIPVKYLSKKSPEGEKPALVQADAKARIYRALEENGLALIGEKERPASKKKFTRLQKYTFSDRAGRKRALPQIVLGAVCAAAGIGIAFLQVTAGAILAVFGAMLLGRAVWFYLGKKRVLSVYEEGVYWKEESLVDSVFLKWEEMIRISSVEQDGLSLLKAECDYGAYHFLSTDSALEFIKELHPEKCGEEN